MRRERPINDLLFDALRAWSDAFERDVISVRIDFADGSSHVAVPPPSFFRRPPVVEVEVKLPPPAAESWPPNTGWSSEGQRFSFDSEVFAVGGRGGDILRLLIVANGPCDLDSLRREVWIDYPCDDSVIRMAVSRLRRNLKEILHLPDDFDPIEAKDNTYRIKRI